MKALVLTMVVAASLPAVGQSPDRGRALRGALEASERSIDKRFTGLFGVDDPFAVQGVPRGVYLEGYGVVFSVEVNLLQVAGLSPFRQTVSKEEIARVHQRKAERVVQLKEKMRAILIDTASSLDPVPDAERVALGVTLFYMHWEDTHDLPSQIVMSAPRRSLVQMKVGRADPSTIQVREF